MAALDVSGNSCYTVRVNEFREDAMSTYKLHDSAKRGCRRCGSETVGWEQNSDGKWYLIELFKDEHDRWIGDRRDFHSKYCKASGGIPELHAKVQNEIRSEWEEDEQLRKQDSEKRQKDREEAEVDMLARFLHMSSVERRDELQRRRDEIAREEKLDPTMDHFTDQQRWRAKLAGLRYELDLLEDFMSELDD